MFENGIKASELIKKLEQMIKLHGDNECFSGGTDYPEGVKEIIFKKVGSAYYHDRCFIIR